ncbi:MAG: hypothetical protein HY075_16880 [Deltaproteobacteria bacterium]|nr:hypothetical protein [Deltaproteobacteria bacterium]
MKRSNGVFAVVCLMSALLHPARASADDGRVEYFKSLSELTLPAVMASKQLHASAALAACTGDAVQLALYAIADTTPFAAMFASLLAKGGSGWDRVCADRGINCQDDVMANLFLGGVVGTAGTAVVEGAYNAGRVALLKNPDVNFSWTKRSVLSAYVATQAKYLESFKDESSFCRDELAKMQLAQLELELRAGQLLSEQVENVRDAKKAANDAIDKALAPIARSVPWAW